MRYGDMEQVSCPTLFVVLVISEHGQRNYTTTTKHYNVLLIHSLKQRHIPNSQTNVIVILTTTSYVEKCICLNTVGIYETN